MRFFRRSACLVLAIGLAGCSERSAPTMSAPSPVPQPPTFPQLVVFGDAASGYSTSDVRDVQGQIVQFSRVDSRQAGELVWTADGTRFPGYQVADGRNYIVDRYCSFCAFEVRFGIQDGERRAYLTYDYGHDNPGTIVDLEVVAGELVMTQTNVAPPGTYSLSGLVFEITTAGRTPVEGVTLQRPNQYAKTDKNGLYIMRGLYAGTTWLWQGKEGYQSHTRDVTINGDTRLDIELVRR